MRQVALSVEKSPGKSRAKNVPGFGHLRLLRSSGGGSGVQACDDGKGSPFDRGVSSGRGSFFLDDDDGAETRACGRREGPADIYIYTRINGVRRARESRTCSRYKRLWVRGKVPFASSALLLQQQQQQQCAGAVSGEASFFQ